MFDKVMVRLAPTYRCLSFDSPGFGQSYQPADIPNLAYAADRLMEAMDDLGVGHFHACGHHTGGCAALEMPSRHPGRVKSLTLIGPVLVNEAENAEYRKTFVRPFAAEPSGAFLQTAWDYLAMLGANHSLELHLREMIDHLIGQRTMPMAFNGVWNQDVESLLKGLTIPLHLMCSKDDVLWPLFERAAALRPDAHTSIVKGADFQPDRDPEGVAQQLLSFLAKIDK